MAPDGRSFVTAVSLQGASLWLHDRSGDRQISARGKRSESGVHSRWQQAPLPCSEGAAHEFAFYRDLGEVMVADLKSGRSEPLVRGFQVLNFDISRGWPRGRHGSARQSRSEPALAGAPGSQRTSAPDPECGGRATTFRCRRAKFSSGIMKGLPRLPAASVSSTAFSRTEPDCKRRSNNRSTCSTFPARYPRMAGGSSLGLRSQDDGPAAGQVYSLDGKPPISLGGNGQVSWGAGGALLSYYGAPEAFYFPLAARQILPPYSGRRISLRRRNRPPARRA